MRSLVLLVSVLASACTVDGGDEVADGTAAGAARCVHPLARHSYDSVDGYFGAPRSYGSPHNGLDIRGGERWACGQAVRSLANGTVREVGDFGVAGLCVIVDSAAWAFSYCHLKPGSLRVVAGQDVHTGQQLAELGTSGRSSPDDCHLHFVARERGGLRDPACVLRALGLGDDIPTRGSCDPVAGIPCTAAPAEQTETGPGAEETAPASSCARGQCYSEDQARCYEAFDDHLQSVPVFRRADSLAPVSGGGHCACRASAAPASVSSWLCCAASECYSPSRGACIPAGGRVASCLCVAPGAASIDAQWQCR
jgi:hypothetical protein